MTTLAEYEQMLAEAEAALRALATGQQVVEVQMPSGQSVKYATPDLEDLRGYINYLISMIQGFGVEVAGKPPNRKPIRFGF